jgi:hypothetical protein
MEQGQQNAYLINNEADLALEAALGRGFTQIINSDAEDYELAASDSGAYLRRTRATAQTVTVPEGLPAGFTAHIRQAGVGALTIVEGSGVTVHADTLDLRAQYSAVTLIRVAADEFDLIGDLAEEASS